MSNIIELKNVNKSFGKHTIFKNLNFEIKKGDMIAFVGKSGCGKTTLLNIMGLLESYDSGSMKINNKDINFKNESSKTILRRNVISYLFQNFALVDNRTVSYNLDIALKYVKGTKSEKESIKRKALKAVGISDLADMKVYKLGGGEQQRVALARTMIKPSEIILADEPTGSLDEENRGNIIGFLKELNNMGKTVVVVTHDPVVAKSCSRIINLV